MCSPKPHHIRTRTSRPQPEAGCVTAQTRAFTAQTSGAQPWAAHVAAQTGDDDAMKPATREGGSDRVAPGSAGGRK